MKKIHRKRGGGDDSLSRGVARILCRQITAKLATSGALERTARITGIARSYLSQIRTGQRMPRNRDIYIRILTEAFGLTFEQAEQVIAKAQLDEMGFLNPELSLRLAELNVLSKNLASNEIRGLIDFLDGWLARRRNDEKKLKLKDPLE